VRVALVCPYSLGVPGGVQAQVTGLARALQRLGHQVEVLAPGPFQGGGAAEGLAVRDLGRAVLVPANGSRSPVAPFPWAGWRALSALARGGFDVVHLHEPLVPGPSSAVLRRFGGAPLVATFHRAGASPAYRLWGLGLRGPARRLAVACAVSPEAAATAAAVVGGEYRILPNGVCLDAYERAEPRPAPGPTVAFVGRHEARKGLDVLLAAYDRLPEGTRLWVASSGPQTGRLKAMSAGRAGIEWLGPVTDEEKASLLKGAHVVCAPARGGESFGLVLLEAMAAGTPVVASDIPGFASVAGPGRCALLVPPGDPEALARALTLVLQDRELAEQLRLAGLARAKELSMDSLARRYLAVYEEAAGRAQV